MYKKITSFVTSDGEFFTNEDEAIQHENGLKEEQLYSVELTFTGYYTTSVHAHSKEEAIEKADNECYPEDLVLELTDSHVEIIGN